MKQTIKQKEKIKEEKLKKKKGLTQEMEDSDTDLEERIRKKQKVLEQREKENKVEDYAILLKTADPLCREDDIKTFFKLI